MSHFRRRHGFSFSLRTLFALVTVLGTALGALGWQMKIVHDREQVRLAVIAEGGFAGVQYFCGTCGPPPPPPIPWIRRLLGDEGAWEIGLRHEVSEFERQRIATLFPESEIKRIKPPIPFDHERFVRLRKIWLENESNQ